MPGRADREGWRGGGMEVGTDAMVEVSGSRLS